MKLLYPLVRQEPAFGFRSPQKLSLFPSDLPAEGNPPRQLNSEIQATRFAEVALLQQLTRAAIDVRAF